MARRPPEITASVATWLRLGGRRVVPRSIRLDVAYSDGRITRYGPVPCWCYGLLWIEARARGMGRGHVVHRLRQLGSLVGVETVRAPVSYRDRVEAELAADPGSAAGFAAELASRR